jgi:hypothetical protein
MASDAIDFIKSIVRAQQKKGSADGEHGRYSSRNKKKSGFIHTCYSGELYLICRRIVTLRSLKERKKARKNRARSNRNQS